MNFICRAAVAVFAGTTLTCANAAAAFTEGENPGCATIHPLDRSCLPAGRSPGREVPLFRQDVAVRRAEFAVIDSFVSPDPDECTVRAQLADVQAKAKLAGADAVIKVRQLNNKRRGFIEDPNTPFCSYTQGECNNYFFRGSAIKYQDVVRGDPTARPAVQLPTPALTPGVDVRRTDRPGDALNRFSPLGSDRREDDDDSRGINFLGGQQGAFGSTPSAGVSGPGASGGTGGPSGVGSSVSGVENTGGVGGSPAGPTTR